ncbi:MULTISPECIES: aldose 1-epimerase family protein [unclassified Microbacterium]|uniref:aldose 1-epimerase family protein n=1 Tax=unclassified Microbacterium TaxID=2609290 RepID=UPI00214CD613|nr:MULTISPECIES: aldose 1-epimerase family protein [unclassified Microbacterium]MCR2784652.1 aldose 1-epimerase family protein [Microbacterium sp. zg.B96]WIM16194.1 aldose 1-epimerase family protein [Microbacterium sp. zg-B96]
MSSHTPYDPTGRRFTVHSGETVAEIAQVGGALRAFQVGGVDLVPRYPDHTPTPAASGVVLVPWPNRVRDGRWTQHGVTHQLALSEPKTGSASHGLLRYTGYQPVEYTEDAITLGADVYPQTGYPFYIATEVTYAVTDISLTVTHRLINLGEDPAPVALGAHPYFCIGDVPTAQLSVQLDAATRFELDDRLLPVAEVPVDDATDLRSPRLLGDLDLNTGYGSIARDDEDCVHTLLTAPDGRVLDVWAGTGFDYLQLFITDRYPDQPIAIAIEPMTAPADAFNSGEGLRWLAPGEQWQLQWGATYRTP